MEIDGFTVAAQLLNFFVLVWLLKKFLYRPVLDAVESRDQDIARQLADVQGKEKAAQQERSQYEQKNAEFEEQRAAAWTVVSEEVKVARDQKLEQVRSDYETQRQAMTQKLAGDQQRMANTIKTEIQQEVFSIARKALADLGSVSVEQQMMDRFMDRLSTLGQEENNKLKEALSKAGQAITVKTALEWPALQREKLQAAISSLTGDSVTIQYQVAPTLIGGIELTAQDYLLSWNIADYLDKFETQVGASLNPKNKPTDGKS